MTAILRPMCAPPDVYRRRRRKLAETLNAPIVLLSGHAPARNYATNPYPFRAGSTYLYFGGYPLEHAALLIEPASDGTSGCLLFRTPQHADDPLWFGALPGDAQVAQLMGIDTSAVCDLDQLQKCLAGRGACAVIPPYPDTIDFARKIGLPAAGADVLTHIVDMRLHKDDHELAAMRRAAAAGIALHRAAMSATRVGATESDAEAAMAAALAHSHCTPSFSPIVTVRGEVLHGECAGRKLEAGAMLLVDAGAEEPTGYASDITRTLPVSGQWSPMQRQLYDTVRRAQQAAIAACTPGKRFREIHHLAAAIVCEGLIDAGLLRGAADDLAGRGAYALFFPHGVGHLLGLDAHDMEDFGDIAGYAPGRTRPTRFGDKSLRLDRDLAPGMVVTIEPGIYLVPAIWQRDDLVGPFAESVNRRAVDALLADQFGGIRIEENVVVRDAGEAPEVLTVELPNEASEVSSLIGK